MYSISVKTVQDVSLNQNLLREVIMDNNWFFRLKKDDELNTTFTALSYDSKNTNESTLFFCKGVTFKKEYLEEAVKRGVTYYISETDYSIPGTVAIIVSDIRKVMALIARVFYDYPENKLKLVGITGTKGKTTTTYLTHSILNVAAPQQTAIISTIGVTLDGHNWKEANLTTPESLDLFKMLATAAENDMAYLVMEVSSQAYKLDRVYGLRFDIGAFLNLSPDHIGPSEHPTMEDYFYCKRQLLNASDVSIINSDTDHFELLHQQSAYYSQQVIAYGQSETNSDYSFSQDPTDPKKFNINATHRDSLGISGPYSMNLLGDFNKENGLCATIIGSLLGVSKTDSLAALKEAVVPGRMEHFVFNRSNHVYVDFAHNYISLKNLLDFAVKEHPENDLTVIIGAPGGKGLSRRKDLGTVLNEYTGKAILTADDPNTESPRKISEEIAQYIGDSMSVEYIDDRILAIQTTLKRATTNETIIIAGKGNDDYLLVNNTKEPYIGDHKIVEQFIQE